jgi:hypothetical protein
MLPKTDWIGHIDEVVFISWRGVDFGLVNYAGD